MPPFFHAPLPFSASISSFNAETSDSKPEITSCTDWAVKPSLMPSYSTVKSSSSPSFRLPDSALRHLRHALNPDVHRINAMAETPVYELAGIVQAAGSGHDTNMPSSELRCKI